MARGMGWGGGSPIAAPSEWTPPLNDIPYPSVGQARSPNRRTAPEAPSLASRGGDPRRRPPALRPPGAALAQAGPPWDPPPPTRPPLPSLGPALVVWEGEGRGDPRGRGRHGGTVTTGHPPRPMAGGVGGRMGRGGPHTTGPTPQTGGGEGGGLSSRGTHSPTAQHEGKGDPVPFGAGNTAPPLGTSHPRLAHPHPPRGGSHQKAPTAPPGGGGARPYTRPAPHPPPRDRGFFTSKKKQLVCPVVSKICTAPTDGT